jgi:nucleoside-diphosphate-sugar epimerase
MRLLVTGASGWIGSAAVTELLAAGHQVLGLARSDPAQAAVARLGAQAVRGSLDDPASLRSAAHGVDGVVHLAYNHDFSRMGEAARTDRAAIDALADALAGSGRPLLIAAGTLGLAPGRVGTEDDTPDPAVHPRVGNAAYALSLAERGIRPLVVRFAPTVHGTGGDHGFVAVLAKTAREKGVAAYIGEGRNRWAAVHRQDAARLVRLAIEKAPSGVLHAVAEEGIATRDIAAALGASLGVPTASLAPSEAVAHFGWLANFYGADAPASSGKTRAALGWAPQGPTLAQDIAAGAYPGESALG